MRFAVFFLTFLTGLSARATELVHRCEQGQIRETPYHVCYDLDPSSPNPDILYVFHGYGESEQIYHDGQNFRAIRDEWRRAGFAAPQTVTVSFGDAWFLTDVRHAPSEALHPLFTRVLLPMIENRLHQLARRGPGRRFLVGESMGGFNVSQLVLKDPALFAGAALVCPAISLLTPASSPGDVSEYLRRNRTARSDWVTSYLKWIRWEYPSPNDWGAHDPLRGASLVRRIGLTLFVMADDGDEYGFFEGAVQFARTLRNRGETVSFESVHGGHCQMNPRSLARFLANGGGAPANPPALAGTMAVPFR